MAYDVPTALDLKERFPSFLAVSDAIIESAITEAQGRVDTTWPEADYAPAIMLYAAHLLTLDGLGSSTEASLAGIKSLTIGSLSLTSAAGGDASGSLASTSYGRRFREMARRNFPAVAVV